MVRVSRTLLAFPAIFPAGATLIEKQQREKSGELVSMALQEASRRRHDAIGAAMGTLGLIAFAY